MDLVTTSVNEAERRKIIYEAIRDLEDANDSWEKNGVTTQISDFHYGYYFIKFVWC